MRKLLPTPPRNDRQTRRKQHKHQCNEKGRRSLLHGEPNGGLPFMLYSFLASVFKSHQSARVLCCISEMSPLAWKNWFSEKNVFPNFSAREKPVKIQKHRTFVRRFLCCIFHQHILGRDGRLELPTSCSQTYRENFFCSLIAIFSHFLFVLLTLWRSYIRCFRVFRSRMW